MGGILETQKKHIALTIARHDRPDQAGLFDLIEEERQQLQANRRYWDKRLAALENELSSEPERIRELYEVKATRIEPIGLVYLWPVTG